MGAPTPAPDWSPDPSGASGRRWTEHRTAPHKGAGKTVPWVVVAAVVLFFGGCATMLAASMNKANEPGHVTAAEVGLNQHGADGKFSFAVTEVGPLPANWYGPGSCPVATPNVQDGPDGKGGCWPGRMTTGPAVTPTQVYPAPAGDRYIIDSDTVIDSKVINHDILVRGGTLTISNSIMAGTVEMDGGAIVVDHSEVHGGDWVGATFDGANITIRSSEITGTPTVVNCSGNCTMTDTYSHDPWFFTDRDQHSSAFATNGGSNMTVRHNTVWCNIQVNPVGGGCTGDLALQTDFANATNITIDSNLFPVSPSGSYCITGGYWPTKPFSNPHDIVITNNVFGKGSNGFCGFYGTSDAFSASAPGDVWSGNVYTDGSPAPANI
jgi:hypothetical protein